MIKVHLQGTTEERTQEVYQYIKALQKEAVKTYRANKGGTKARRTAGGYLEACSQILWHMETHLAPELGLPYELEESHNAPQA